MTWLQKIIREPALLLGLVTAAIGLYTAFGGHITETQVGAVMAVLGALVALLRYVLTPSVEVIAQQKPGGPVTATERAESRWGIRRGRVVAVTPSPDVVNPADPPAAA